jgi:hypothetical protein
VTKATPTLTWTPATSIVYGTLLTLNAVATLADGIVAYREGAVG